MKIKRIVTNVATHQFDAVKRFYGEILGLDVLMEFGWIMTMGADAQMPMQISFASEGGSGQPLPRLSIEVDDLDEALKRFKDAGITPEYGPADEPWGIRRFFVRDPMGQVINISTHL